MTLHGLRPTVRAGIDGHRATFLLDSGAAYSTISEDTAARYRLSLHAIPGDDLYLSGAGGGMTRPQLATVRTFSYLSAPLHHVQFLVIPENFWGHLAGSIGQNLLRISDVEYDLADGLVRFIRPAGCAGQPLAYWADKTPYSVVKLRYAGVVHPQMLTHAEVNGRRITVLLDTGAPRSILSLQAARRAGITRHSPGVKPLGLAAGLGGRHFALWSAPVAQFQIGGERIEHTHLLIGNIDPRGPTGQIRSHRRVDMLLGADFFLSQRIYVAYSQRRIYFTYHGGPLFNLNLPQYGETVARARRAPGPRPPLSAAELMRRGLALAAMREFRRAIADLSRACRLAPHDAQDRYERGRVSLELHRDRAALADFDAALALAPADVEAHLARATVRLTHPDAAAHRAQIDADLAVMARRAAREADLRLELGLLYGLDGEYRAGLTQINRWLATHRTRSEQATGLNERCWLRATADRALHRALADCTEAINLTAQRTLGAATGLPYMRRTLANHGDPAVRASRGLVYLRLGRDRRAIRDFDAVLAHAPQSPISLYARGLAELHLGEPHRAAADLSAARRDDARIGAEFRRFGLIASPTAPRRKTTAASRHTP
ncbi:MAG: aspartyl protease family protein [Steroidobacteraceae bacterium]